MGISDGSEAGDFVEAAIRLGVMPTDLATGLHDDLPEVSFPGEEPMRVLLEMLLGTLRPVIAGPTVVRTATLLLDAAGDRVVDDLREAQRRAS